jgi:oligosaccharide repeat unit polymerase
VLLGSRGEAIAPIVLFLWFRLQFGKPVRVFALVLVGALTAVLFAAVSSLRASNTVRYPVFEEFLWQTSSPQLLTSVVTARVPSAWPFFEGDTYLKALQNFLPGPISRALFGDVQGTGALVYRDIAGITSANQGYGFALPTEAYLNFGNWGVLIIAALLGAIIGFAYKWANDPNRSFKLSSFVYPLVISYLPYGLRSDFLGQFKSIVYPLIILGVLVFVSNAMSRTFGKNKSSSLRAAPYPRSSPSVSR